MNVRFTEKKVCVKRDVDGKDIFLDPTHVDLPLELQSQFTPTVNTCTGATNQGTASTPIADTSALTNEVNTLNNSVHGSFDRT